MPLTDEQVAAFPLLVEAIPLVRLGNPPYHKDYTPRTYGMARRALRCVGRWVRRHIADREE